MLKNATQKLYTVFSKYYILNSLRERSCNCCVSDQDIKQLFSKQLKELDKDDLYWFMTKAMTTFGDVNDYKHFLPRILELMQNKDSDVIDDFLTFEKLNYAKWKTWSSEEIEAIENYFLALWEYKIKDETSTFYELQDILKIIEMYVGLDKALKIWEINASKQSILFIVDQVWNTYNYKNNVKTNKLFQWYSKDFIKEKIFDLYFKTEDNIEASKLSIVYSILDNNENKNPK